MSGATTAGSPAARPRLLPPPDAVPPASHPHAAAPGEPLGEHLGEHYDLCFARGAGRPRFKSRSKPRFSGRHGRHVCHGHRDEVGAAMADPDGMRVARAFEADR